MPFDAMFLTAVAAELRPALVGARVDKIQQPARDTVVLQLRGRDGGGRLLLSANGSRPRVHLTQAQLENPAQPPMFCMLLRKHLACGRLADIRQPAAERMRQRSQTLRKAISNLHERTRRKLELQRQELEATHDREQLRRQGDIVTANLHAITRGQTLLRAEDLYDEDLREIEIPLKPNLSPQQNAARFYKDYARAKHAEQVLTQQIAQGEIEEAYLGGVLEELARAENERDLSEIRAELEAGGYVRPADRRKQVKQQPSKPMHFRSSDGFDIFVGRNNRQNDQLSLKTARRDDLWLHVQKFHGTHVIIACAGVQPPDGTITEAAELAAYYSEARESQNVPVDVTPVRCLRKPNGAKPGMVVYDRYRTVLVTPDAALPARLRVE